MDICPLEMFSRYLLLYRVSHTTCPLLINQELHGIKKFMTFLIYGVCKKLVPASFGTVQHMFQSGIWLRLGCDRRKWG